MSNVSAVNRNWFGVSKVPMRQKRFILAFFALVGVVAFAVAGSVGKFYCSTCTFDEEFAFGDTEMFIRAEVNKFVDSWVDSKGNAKQVTICNGSICATYTYVKLSGVWKAMQRAHSSWTGQGQGGSGTGGGSVGGGSTCVGNCTPIVTVGQEENIP